jgi:hypothetical protein
VKILELCDVYRTLKNKWRKGTLFCSWSWNSLLCWSRKCRSNDRSR